MNIIQIFNFLYTSAILYVPVSAAVISPHYTFHRGVCVDFCAHSIDGLALRDKVQLTSRCSSYLSTSIVSTVITVTSVTTITRFKNNGDHNPSPSQPTLQIQETKTTWSGADGLWTIAPTYVPNEPFRWPACKPRKYGEEVFTTQFNSVCGCQGVTPVTASFATLTATVTKPHATTVTLFKLKALFKNGTNTYLEPKKGGNHSFATNLTSFWVLAFDANKDGRFLFSLTPERNLRCQSRGVKGWRPAFNMGGINGELLSFLREENEMKVDGDAPRYYIDVENSPGEGHALVREGENAGKMGFFAVELSGVELRWFGGEKSVMDLANGQEPVHIFAEPAHKMGRDGRMESLRGVDQGSL